MSKIFFYGNEIRTFFDLLGSNEDDITRSISWVLSKCPVFLKSFVNRLLPSEICHPDNTVISSQEVENENGRTDIQIYEPGDYRIVVEAKKGWSLPSNFQLGKYTDLLLKKYTSEKIKIVYSMSDCSPEYAISKLPSHLDRIEIKHIPYLDVIRILEQSIYESGNREKKLIRELVNYLKGVTRMENEYSNQVYVVPIGPDSVKRLIQDNVYECPVGGNYPVTAPNYLGFRYGGKLQAICHVDNVEYIEKINGIYFLFHLGKAIKPENVRSGAVWNQRFYIDIDLLLTSPDVKEAKRLNDIRHS